MSIINELGILRKIIHCFEIIHTIMVVVITILELENSVVFTPAKLALEINLFFKIILVTIVQINVLGTTIDDIKTVVSIEH